MLTDNVLDLIGHTPLLRLKGEPIFCKAEFLNPGGSIKDRVALAMLEGARRDGKLKPDSIIGTNVWAARQLARRVAGTIATVLPDRAERYFRTARL